jgi:hypothetical protein
MVPNSREVGESVDAKCDCLCRTVYCIYNYQYQLAEHEYTLRNILAIHQIPHSLREHLIVLQVVRHSLPLHIFILWLNIW